MINKPYTTKDGVNIEQKQEKQLFDVITDL